MFKIEGHDGVFEIVDQSKTQTVYGAVAFRTGEDGQPVRFHSEYVTPFPDMVEPL